MSLWKLRQIKMSVFGLFGLIIFFFPGAKTTNFWKDGKTRIDCLDWGPNQTIEPHFSLENWVSISRKLTTDWAVHYLNVVITKQIVFFGQHSVLLGSGKSWIVKKLIPIYFKKMQVFTLLYKVFYQIYNIFLFSFFFKILIFLHFGKTTSWQHVLFFQKTDIFGQKKKNQELLHGITLHFVKKHCFFDIKKIHVDEYREPS